MATTDLQSECWPLLFTLAFWFLVPNLCDVKWTFEWGEFDTLLEKGPCSVWTESLHVAMSFALTFLLSRWKRPSMIQCSFFFQGKRKASLNSGWGPKDRIQDFLELWMGNQCNIYGPGNLALGRGDVQMMCCCVRGASSRETLPVWMHLPF